MEPKIDTQAGVEADALVGADRGENEFSQFVLHSNEERSDEPQEQDHGNPDPQKDTCEGARESLDIVSQSTNSTEQHRTPNFSDRYGPMMDTIYRSEENERNSTSSYAREPGNSPPNPLPGSNARRGGMHGARNAPRKSGKKTRVTFGGGFNDQGITQRDFGLEDDTEGQTKTQKAIRTDVQTTQAFMSLRSSADLQLAIQIPLPVSAASSIVSEDLYEMPQNDPQVSFGQSMEQLDSQSMAWNSARVALGNYPIPSEGLLIQNHIENSFQIEPQSARSSLEVPMNDLPSRRSADSTRAHGVPLPISRSSTIVSETPPHGVRTMPLGDSLEHLQTHSRPENPGVSKRKRKGAFLQWIAGASTSQSKSREQRSSEPQTQPTPPPARTAATENYRRSIRTLASHFSTFKNVAATDARHEWNTWTPRIVFYDHHRTAQDEEPIRHEPWENCSSAPPYQEFKETLRGVSEDCDQRLVLVEDLTPSLIDLLGATFRIPPHVFEEHLDRSGYTETTEQHDDASTWHTRPSAQGYSSVTWYRPVLSLVPLTNRFRKKLIEGGRPRVRCPLEGCASGDHNLWLSTLTNTWRHQLDLCTEPGDYYKTSPTEYPVGWEERATIWSREISGCTFVIILLDPLPTVDVAQQEDAPHKQRHRLEPMIANYWVRMEQVQAARAHRSQQTREQSQAHQRVADWKDQDPFETPPEALSSVAGASNSVQTEQQPPGVQPTSTNLGGPQANAHNFNVRIFDEPPVTLRRRNTKPFVEDSQNATKKGHRNWQNSSWQKLIVADRNAVLTLLPFARLVSHPRSPPSSSISEPEYRDDILDIDIHDPFVIYQPVKSRSSSLAWSDEMMSPDHMHTWISNFQSAKSTLDEFDHFLQLPSKGKTASYDPFQALFRTIYDDSNSLVDIVRTSMQHIREGTLKEEFMQKRVEFWRSRLHRLSFHIGVLDQSLRELEQFVFESKVHVLEAKPLSQKLAKDTQQTLRGCMELIDRSSHSLLAEMQIADSRRGIAEAESVSKLTELAFVFVPLSFVASLFSMQIHELEGGVPLYQFAAVAVGLVIGAYAVRLSLRSSPLIEYRDKVMDQIREDSDLQPNAKVPTHKFLTWVGTNFSSMMWRHFKNMIAVLTPLVLVLAVVTGILSPIVLLWQRSINAGFSIAITVLILLLDAMLAVPVAVNMSNAGIVNFDPRARIRRIQEAHEESRKRRRREKKRRRREAGLDPEAPDDESSVDIDIDKKIKTGSSSFIS